MQRIREDLRADEYQDDGTGMSHGAYSTNAPKVIPYDTGKVRIGCRWEPPLYVPTRSEALIQDAILGSGAGRSPWWRHIVRVFR